MLASPPFWAVWTDVLWCLGLGLALAAARDLAQLLFGDSSPVQFALDLLQAGCAAVLLCGFAAGLSASGGVRWYMAAALLLGGLGWRWSGSLLLHRAFHRILRLLTLPFRGLQRLTRPLARRIRILAGRRRAEKADRKRQKSQKKHKNRLQNPTRILYN